MRRGGACAAGGCVGGACAVGGCVVGLCPARGGCEAVCVSSSAGLSVGRWMLVFRLHKVVSQPFLSVFFVFFLSMFLCECPKTMPERALECVCDVVSTCHRRIHHVYPP